MMASNTCLITARKRTLQALAVLLSLSTGIPAQADTATIVIARAYHVEGRTRIVLETSRPVTYQMLLLTGPDRLVLDMQDVKLDETLKAISSKIRPDDPYIKQVRMAYFKPKVVRVVFDLKTEVKPSSFTLVPMGNYQDRLVLDILPPDGMSPSTPPEKASEHTGAALPSQEVAAPPPKATAAEPQPDALPDSTPATKPPAGSIVKTPVADAEPGMEPAGDALPPRALADQTAQDPVASDQVVPDGITPSEQNQAEPDQLKPEQSTIKNDTFSGTSLFMTFLIAGGLLLMLL